MISVVDLAFEIWFADSGEPAENKQIWRTNVWDPIVAQNKYTPKMEVAYKHAVTVMRLAGQGFFAASPVGPPVPAAVVN